MSGVTVQGGIEAIQAKKETIEFRVIVPNAALADSALLGWLNEAQRNGTLLTIDLEVNEADEQAQGQLRLFADLITENAPVLSARQAVATAARVTRARRARTEAPAGGGDDPGDYGNAVPATAEDTPEDLSTD
jgi:hypothetical protein